MMKRILEPLVDLAGSYERKRTLSDGDEMCEMRWHAE